MDHRIQRLLESRDLEAVEPKDTEIIGFWQKACRAFDDARLPETSAEGSIDRGYQAGFLAATAVLHAAGYRVRGRGGGHHYNTFYALTALEDPDLARLAAELNDLRVRRHEALYEAVAEPEDEEVARLVLTVRELLRAGRSRLVAGRPGLHESLGEAGP